MCIVALPAVAALAGAGATAAGTAGMITASTAAWISLGATAVGTAASMYGTAQQSKAQAGQYKYQAAVDRNNQIISGRQADDAIKRGESAEEQHRMKVQGIKADQRVGFASRGIDLGSDVVIDTLSDTAMLGELDALTIRSNAAREAYGYKVQGMNYGDSSANNLLSAKNTTAAGKTAMASSLLSGAATVAGNYAGYADKGVFSSSPKET